MTLVFKVNRQDQVICFYFFEISDLENVRINTKINTASYLQVLLRKDNLKEVWPQISRSSVKVTWFILTFFNFRPQLCWKRHQPCCLITSTSENISINKQWWKQCILTTYDVMTYVTWQRQDDVTYAKMCLTSLVTSLV